MRLIGASQISCNRSFAVGNASRMGAGGSPENRKSGNAFSHVSAKSEEHGKFFGGIHKTIISLCGNLVPFCRFRQLPCAGPRVKERPPEKGGPNHKSRYCSVVAVVVLILAPNTNQTPDHPE
jgi:hypothetical protein